jgi:alkenylglycerophosphocholine/alkenylglycerophosphoethanolamine hydrolase
MDQHLRILIRLYVIIAACFVVSLLFHPYPGSFLIKPLPVLIMAFLSWRYLEGAERMLMTLGFLFSALGDIFLDLDRVAYFKQGLVSFLVTQILFSIAFYKRRIINVQKLIAASLVLAYALFMLILLWPHLGELRIPVIVYLVALTSMGVFAGLRAGPLSGVYLGGFLFVIADSLIAVNKFLVEFDYSLMIIIGLYLTGQFFIGRGVLAGVQGD